MVVVSNYSSSQYLFTHGTTLSKLLPISNITRTRTYYAALRREKEINESAPVKIYEASLLPIKEKTVIFTFDKFPFPGLKISLSPVSSKAAVNQ